MQELKVREKVEKQIRSAEGRLCKDQPNFEYTHIECKMQDCLHSIGLPLTVCCKPSPQLSIHGEIKDSTIFIYDTIEREAWNTFIHEVCEYKLQAVTRPYRLLINSLMEVIEKSIYAQKEGFIESMPIIIEAIQKMQI